MNKEHKRQILFLLIFLFGVATEEHRFLELKVPLLNVISAFFRQENGDWENGMIFPIFEAGIRGRSRSEPRCLNSSGPKLLMSFDGSGEAGGKRMVVAVLGQILGQVYWTTASRELEDSNEEEKENRELTPKINFTHYILLFEANYMQSLYKNLIATTVFTTDRNHCVFIFADITL